MSLLSKKKSSHMALRLFHKTFDSSGVTGSLFVTIRHAQPSLIFTGKVISLPL